MQSWVVFAVLDVNSSTPVSHFPTMVLGGVAANLPGPLQTANRAAVAALEFIVSRFTDVFEVVPDSAYLVNGYNSGTKTTRKPLGQMLTSGALSCRQFVTLPALSQ